MTQQFHIKLYSASPRTPQTAELPGFIVSEKTVSKALEKAKALLWKKYGRRLRSVNITADHNIVAVVSLGD